MNDFKLNRFQAPIVTGFPQIKEQSGKKPEENKGQSFKDVLGAQLNAKPPVEFTKHAATRVTQRKIDISPENIERLNQGVKLAEKKGLNDTLILVDKTAFLVNVKNNKVITTVNGDELMGNVFTNIDGTVIV